VGDPRSATASPPPGNRIVSLAGTAAANFPPPGQPRQEPGERPPTAIADRPKRRIEELSARRTSITDSLKTLEASRPTGARPEEIKAMLDAVPDVRSALPDYNPEDLAELFDALQVEVTYDKPKRALEVAATLTPELALPNETERPPQGRSLNSVIAGAGFGQTSATAYRLTEVRQLP